MSAPTAPPTAGTSMSIPSQGAPSVSAADGICPCHAAISPRDQARIATLAPEFQVKAVLLLRLMAMAGHRMFVTGARRTTAEQYALYAQGRTEPGRVVTHSDGMRRRSRHQDGMAMDCAFVGEDIWSGPWEMYAKFAEGLGLIAGAHWKQFQDRPHVEMPS